MRYPWKLCSINYCRITVSAHFYWFPFIKSVNITFYFAKVCFFPYLLLIKIVKSTGWDFQMLMYKKQSSKWYKCLTVCRVWGSASNQSPLNILQILQNKVARWIVSSKIHEITRKELHSNLNWLTVKQRIYIRTVTILHKAIYNCEPLSVYM
jgi:predicted DNA-binding ArsR family transcriptional regulator